MKNRIYLSLLLLSLVISLAFTSKEKVDYYYYYIVIEQNGKILKPKNGIINLKKEPFKFKVTMDNTDHIYVSASWDTYYYDYPENENIFKCDDDVYLKDCRFVAVKTGNQDKFNEEKDLAIGDGSYQWVWFYSEQTDWHRFDKGITVKDGIINAEMTVENIYDCDKRDERKYEENEYSYPIENVDKNIHLVFATSKYEKGMDEPEELQRNKYILTFE